MTGAASQRNAGDPRRPAPRAAVLGASVAGAAMALQLARRGWAVTVVDPDLDRFARASETPTARPGAPHSVQAHGWMARTATELRERLPDVRAGVLAEGAHELRFADRVPAALLDGGRPGDGGLTMLLMRRLVLDRVLWRLLLREPGVTTRTGRAGGLVTTGTDPVMVRGVRLAGGGQLEADVVLDCTGRRTRVTAWLAAVGAVEYLQERACGATYYGRHYRVGPGERPPLNAVWAQVNMFPRLANLWFLGDRDHAMLALAVHDRDRCARTLRRAEALQVVAEANPGLAPWLAMSTPTTGVFAMGAMRNRLRRTVREGRPVALGLHHVGDSLANSNPTRGRGVATSLASAGALVDVMGEFPRDPEAQALCYDDWVAGPLAVYWREASVADEAAGRRLRAGARGAVVPENAPAVEVDGASFTSGELERAAWRDPDLIRVLVRATHLLDDARAVASPETAQRVRSVLATIDGDTGKAPEGETDEAETVDSTAGLEDPAYLDHLLAPYR